MNNTDKITLMRRLVVFLLFTFIFLLFVHNLQSYDTWWHLKTGQYIIQNHAIPHSDPYSYVSGGKPWVDLQWFFQVVIFLVFNYLGLGGLVLFKALLLTAVFFILFRTVSAKTGRNTAGAALVFLGALCTWERGALRPELFSFFYLSLFLYILHRYKYSGRGFDKKLIYLLPVVQLFWVNSHALFVLGILLVSTYIIGEAIGSRTKLPFFADAKYRITGGAYRHLLISAFLVIFVSFLNPYAGSGFFFPLTLFSRINGTIKVFSTLGEFQSPFSGFCQNSTIFFYKLLLVISLPVLLANLRRLSLSHFFSYLVFLYLSLLSRRNIPFFAMACVPIIAENLRQVIERRGRRFFASGKVRVAGSLAMAVVLVLGIIDLSGGAKYVRGDGEARGFSLGAAPFKFPRGAATFVEQARLKGNIFNDLQSGNYLIWRLCPARRVFLDGRLEVHGEDFYTEYVRLLDDPRLWPVIAGKYNISYALFTHTDADFDKLMDYLCRDPEWKPVYFDDLSVIFLKDIPENRAAIKKYQLDMFSSDFADLTALKGLSDALASRLYFQRGNFFAKFSNFAKAKENYLKVLARDVFNERVYINMGIIYARENDFLTAERQYRAALTINPCSGPANFNLASLYYRQGHMSLAIKYYFDAVRCGAGVNGGYYNLGGICLAYGQYKQAAKWYLKLLETRPWNISARLNLGVAYAGEGFLEKARKEFIKVLEADPQNFPAGENLKKMDMTGQR